MEPITNTGQQLNRQGIFTLPNSSNILVLGIIAFVCAFLGGVSMLIGYILVLTIALGIFGFMFWIFMGMMFLASLTLGVIALIISRKPAKLIKVNPHLYKPAARISFRIGWILALVDTLVSVAALSYICSEIIKRGIL